MCFLGFAGFLRFSEIVHIRYSDICLQDICVEINIVKSKTEVCKSGQKVCPFPSQVTIIFIVRAMGDRESYCVLVKPFKSFLCSHFSSNHQSEKTLIFRL